MNLRTRAIFFLIEQIVAITVFAICTAVCAGVFAEAYYKASDAKDVNYALAAAKNGAEAFKAFGTPEEAAAAIVGGEHEHGGAAVYYDADWQPCEGPSPSAEYVMRLTGIEGAVSPLLCELTVERITGEIIIGFTVAAKGGQRSG